MHRLDGDTSLQARVYGIQSVQSRPHAYEGHMFHDDVQLQQFEESIVAHAGDYLVSLDQPHARYIVRDAGTARA